jgi:hypothetical protein
MSNIDPHQNTTQKTRKMSNIDPTKNRWWKQVLVKCKQSLPLVYVHVTTSLIFSNREQAFNFRMVRENISNSADFMYCMILSRPCLVALCFNINRWCIGFDRT